MCWLRGSVLPVYIILGSHGWSPAPEAHLMNTKPLGESEAPNQWVNAVPWNFLACVEYTYTIPVLFNQIELPCDNPESSFYCVKAFAPSHLLPALNSIRTVLVSSRGIPSFISFPFFLFCCHLCVDKLFQKASFYHSVFFHYPSLSSHHLSWWQWQSLQLPFRCLLPHTDWSNVTQRGNTNTTLQ